MLYGDTACMLLEQKLFCANNVFEMTAGERAGQLSIPRRSYMRD